MRRSPDAAAGSSQESADAAVGVERGAQGGAGGGAGVDEGEEPEQGHRAEAADDHDGGADDGHADLAGLGGGFLAAGVARTSALRSGSAAGVEGSVARRPGCRLSERWSTGRCRARVGVGEGGAGDLDAEAEDEGEEGCGEAGGEEPAQGLPQPGAGAGAQGAGGGDRGGGGEDEQGALAHQHDQHVAEAGGDEQEQRARPRTVAATVPPTLSGQPAPAG